jgi:hypothetical protein
VLWIFIALKNPSFSIWFEAANLGSNGKHDNHKTAEAELVGLTDDSVLLVTFYEM